MSKNAVKKQEKNEVSTDLLLEDMIADAGYGMEDTKSSDITTPFVRILQALSPELEEGKSSYIQGAKKGMLFNNATREVFKEMKLIPCYFKTQFVEWRLRDSGGGLVAIHEDEGILKTTTRNDKNQDMTPQGTEIVRTGMFFGLRILDAEKLEFECVAIPMQKTQFKKAKNLNALIQRNTVRHPKTGEVLQKPAFSQVFTFKTVTESNKKGQSFDNWAIEKACDVQELKNASSFYQAAKLFYETVKSGNVKVEGYENEEAVDIDASNVM